MAVRIHGTFGSWVLPQGESVLGRGSACNVKIDDPRLSRKHAGFTLDGHTLKVHELGSTNGILVDGRRIQGASELHHGAVVVCGPVVLMVSIDQTQPHPRQTVGGQDPGTRRQSPHGNTEAMLEAITEHDKPPHPPSTRFLDPAIAAAISTPGTAVTVTVEDPRQSSLQPAEAPGSATSPLDAVRPDFSKQVEQRRSPTTTSSLEAVSLAPSVSGALEQPEWATVPAAHRLAAGAVDGLLTALLALPGPLMMVLGYGVALSLAGAAVVDGVPRIGPGVPAGIFELIQTLGSSAGLARAGELMVMLAGASRPAILVLLGSVMLGALGIMVAIFLRLAVPTVELGAPAAHRRRGLEIVRVANGTRLVWWQACLRWLLAMLLWPLAVPAALFGGRAPHDLLCGSVVRRARGLR